MPPKTPEHPEILQALSRLYDEIDGKTARLSQIHAGRLHCRCGCADCCVDDISVNEAEALNIRRSFSDLLRNEQPHPEGSCAFLSKDKICRIYSRRPYVCRTQGLPLHWIEEDYGQIAAMRDICPHNEQGTPVEQLPEDECWPIGPVEMQLAKLQWAQRKEIMKRIKLRDLFDSLSEPPRP